MPTAKKANAKKKEQGIENYALEVESNKQADRFSNNDSMSSILAEAAASCASIAFVSANAHGSSNEGKSTLL
jgi:hypothetical protein